MNRIHLGVNIDHVATLRRQRDTLYPEPVAAAHLAELAGADQITVHLREDRRHITDRDLQLLRKTVQTRLNLEMAATQEMVEIARIVGPDQVTLVPEKREERTTEGGLDVAGQQAGLAAVIAELRGAGTRVITFIDPDEAQIQASRLAGAQGVELHTGDYCEAAHGPARDRELMRLIEASQSAAALGLFVAAGHGLDYANLEPICAIPEIHELNIGHSIISRAVLIGLERAVRQMREAMDRFRVGAG